jgi:predicted Holliday junction resolvase-like endonuclease
MNDGLAIALLAIAVLALVRISVAHARYRAVYRYADQDLADARADAIKRSRRVLAGRAGEQLVPLAPQFFDRFDPSEARFLGAPVDYVVFDGIGEGELREVVLVEVKTGSGKLNRNERQVARAVRDGRVRFELLRLE